MEFDAKGIPKWNQHRCDAKTHRKSMPKLVMEKIRRIIKNHVSLNGKTLKFIEKHVFLMV